MAEVLGRLSKIYSPLRKMGFTIAVIITLLMPAQAISSEIGCQVVNDLQQEQLLISRFREVVDAMTFEGYLQEQLTFSYLRVIECDYLIIFEQRIKTGTDLNIFGMSEAFIFSREEFQFLGPTMIP